jgi:NADH-ubiquinone oxidoreductase chain 1
MVQRVFTLALRSTAQLISYELVLTSALLVVIIMSGSLNLTENIESQRSIWYIIPLLPVFIIFYICSVAESNRAPMDLAEAKKRKITNIFNIKIFVFGKNDLVSKKITICWKFLKL